MGYFLYYAWSVNSTILKALGYITAQKKMQKVKQLLDYAATHLYAIITYHASDMVLAGHSDTSYLSETISRSRAGGGGLCVKKHLVPSQKWIIVDYSQNRQGNHAISGRGLSGGTICQLQRSHTSKPTPRGNGAHTTTNTNANRQYNCTWRSY